jgi:UDP-N-acetyl-D-glucosamine/UDP-N-acetyl-D-galactosamine dehydrogenase
MIEKNVTVAVVGLGYVGLPLAVEFGARMPTIGFDINQHRVNELVAGVDETREVLPEELRAAHQLSFTTNADDLRAATVFIVTVPTPIDQYKKPDLSPLELSSQTVGRALKVGDTVIYESTVYPGATEEVCVPILERESGLRFNQDFFVGYSPERINPGDKEHRLPSILKVTSGSNPETAEFVDNLYRMIITAGTHKASSIRVAEAAKVIENTQRDINIALINELALIFNRLGIDTQDVLEAAATKWNFLRFSPGLVGGHCIGVDPYYLTHKAIELGYNPEIILAGRRLNDAMGEFVADEMIRLMARRGIEIVGARVLVMGLTFKENCPDLRNTRVVDIVARLGEYSATVDVYDPWVNAEEAVAEYGIQPIAEVHKGDYDAIVVTVSHDEFKKMGIDGIRALGKDKHVVYDVKHVFSKNETDGRL